MSNAAVDRGRSRRHGGSTPTVLVRLFGTDRVCSLHAALRCLLATAAPRLETLRRGDSPAYRHLLQKALVVTVAPRPLWQHVQPLPAATPCQALCSQAEAVARAADVVARQGGWGGSSGNVLCAGDGSSSGPPRGGRQGPAGAPAAPEWTRVNCAAQALQSAEWGALLGRIGDTVMVHLLAQYAVFMALPNGSFLQLTGPNVSNLAKRLQPLPAAPLGLPPLAFRRGGAADKAPGAAQATAMPSPQTPPLRLDTPVGTADGDMADADVAAHGEDAGAGAQLTQPPQRDVDMDDAAPPAGAPAPPVQRLSLRPPSWQRRRAARARALGGQQGQGGEVASQEPGMGEAVTPPHPALQPPQAPQAPPQGVENPRHKKAGGAGVGAPVDGGGAASRGSWGGIQVSSRTLFYSAAFPRRAGLPRDHVLNRATRGDSSGASMRAGRRLWRAIFGQRLVRVVEPTGNAYQKEGAAIPLFTPGAQLVAKLSLLPHPRRVKPAWQHLIRPLAAIVRAASRCPFRALLEAHCPLPAELPAAARARPRLVRRSTPATGIHSQFTSVSAHTPGDGDDYFVDALSDGDDEDDDTDDRAGEAATQEDARGEQAAPQRHAAAATPGALTQAQLLRCYTPQSDVARFVWAVVKRIVPLSLLGGAAGRIAVRHLIRRVCSLRRYQSMTLHAAMQRLPLRAWAVLRPNGRAPGRETGQSLSAHALRVAKLVRFLVTSLCMPLIRTHFYVTEGEAHRGRVFYYRKPVWSAVRTAALRTSMKEAYRPVRKRATLALLRGRTLGVASLRLLPKPSGVVRPIANLGRAMAFCVPLRAAQRRRLRGIAGVTTAGGAAAGVPGARGGTAVVKFKPVNQELRPVLSALRCETQAAPPLLGSAVCDYGALYSRMAPFIREQRVFSAQQEPGLKRPVFLVAADISRAFDTLPLEKLCALAEKLLGAAQYRIMKYVTVTPAPSGRLRVRYSAVAAPGEGDAMPSLADAIHTDRPTASCAILVDSATQHRVSRGELVRRLREHLGATLVRLGGAFFVQQVGVPQGSVLSTLLCSALYADMETSKKLGESPDSAARGATESLLLRWVDDFLFMTTSVEAATRFVDTLSSGFPEYGAAVSVSKTCLNFDAWGPDGRRLPRNEHATPDGRRHVRWCGLLVDSGTLEVQADNSRLMGIPIGDVVHTPGRDGPSPGSILATRLRAYLRPKAAALLFDAQLNGPTTAAVNVLQCFLVAALKLHAYVADALHRPQQDALLAAAITDALRYGARLVASRLQAAPGAAKLHPALRGCAIKYLGMMAFHRVLARKHSRYAPLLAWLQRSLGTHAMRAVARRPAIAAAMEPARAEALMRAKF